MVKPRGITPAAGIRTLCTLGPASLDEKTIRRLDERGVGCFRINMSHTTIPQLCQAIELIRQHSDVTICIDTEGAQARTGRMEADVEYRHGQRVRLVAHDVVGNEQVLPIRPVEAIRQLRVGSVVAVDFDSTLLLVTETNADGAASLVINGGVVKSNRAITVHPSVGLPPVSSRDREAIAIGRELGILEYALSFANSAEDVALLRELAGPAATIVAKIESKAGVLNLSSILAVADAILIDRGDLSREVPLENIPFLQKLIIQQGRSAGRSVYVATNLLESMLVHRKPTRAELNDVINTLMDGANGLVLAAETAIGQQPVAALDMLVTLIRRFEESLRGYRTTDLLEPSSLLLPKMHGGDSTQPRVLGARPGAAALVGKVPVVDLDEAAALDVQHIVSGAYAPLDGFMTRPELEAVLTDCRLPSGVIWPLPIVLQVPRDAARDAAPGRTVALRRSSDGRVGALLHVRDCFAPPLEEIAHRWFGTTSRKHPGVARLLAGGEILLGGPIELVDPQGLHDGDASFLTPEQTRLIFSVKGWKNVVAFHSTGIPDLRQEWLMREAVARTNADGLFLHPMTGGRSGDPARTALLGAYDILVDEAFPGALFGPFPIYPRHGGARERVFLALCRKNFGCTHFVLGTDDSELAEPSGPQATQKLLDSLGDIGIEPVLFDQILRCHDCGEWVERCAHPARRKEAFDGRKIDQALSAGQPVPEWAVRPSIARFVAQNRTADELMAPTP